MLVKDSNFFKSSKCVFAFLKYLYEDRNPLFNSILDDIGKLEYFHYLEKIEKLKEGSFFMFYTTFRNELIGKRTSFCILCSLLQTKDTKNEDFSIYLLSTYISSNCALRDLLYNYYDGHVNLFLEVPYNPLDKLIKFPNQKYWIQLSSAKIDGFLSSGKKTVLL